MIGGLIQLITTGIEDAPLTYQPEITFFKMVYKQCTNFALIQNTKNLGNKNFNTVNSYKIENIGDLLKSMYYVLKIPKFNIIKNTNKNNIVNKYYNINQLEILYSNIDSYIYNLNNEYIILPKYIFTLFDINTQKKILDSNIVINNLLPEIIKITDLPFGYNIIELDDNPKNSIITQISKLMNWFENYLTKLCINSNDFQLCNQLITQYSYTNSLNKKVNDYLYTSYNYFNNLRNNKSYYNLYEVHQYLEYKNTDLNFIKQSNYDMDIIYNYCLQNNINNFLEYQLNGLYYNSLFIYNILEQLYSNNFTYFTFYKKYLLQTNNIPNLNFIINENNSYNEWSTYLNNNFDPIINSKLQIFEIYKRQYSITQNKINLLFDTLIIKDPSILYIILSTFINKYDRTTTQVNFDDYNQTSNIISLLNDDINDQVNNYSTLIRSNSIIQSNQNISKTTIIYPIDLMLIYPYLAYKLIEKIINLSYFNDNTFLIYWRNKINNYYFLNYLQNKTNNDSNTDLNDTIELERRLTFYINLCTNKFMFLKQLKQYFIELFYSTSFFGVINMLDSEFINLKNSLNNIDFTNYNTNNEPINLNNELIKKYLNFKMESKYIINDFSLLNNTITINNWYNNNKFNTVYSIINNSTNLIYTVDKFILNNTTLILYFNNKIDLTDQPIFTLVEIHNIDLPFVNFIETEQQNSNTITVINLYNVIDNNILNDNIMDEFRFNISNFNFTSTNEIINYYNYLKVVTIKTKTDIFHYLVDIQNNQNSFNITSKNNKIFIKDDIIEVNIEFINIIFNDVTTIDSNTIENYIFPIPTSQSWTYNSLKTYWLVLNDNYYLLKYDNDNFIIYDSLPNGIYTLREIDNSYIPSLFNYCNHYTNSNKISDLFDYYFQTSFILLGKTDISKPYIYIYNLPFNSNETTIYYINNYLVNVLLPLNINQYFGKKISPIFNYETIKNNNNNGLIDSMINLFDLQFNDPDYINIINVIEQSQTEIINLNLSILNDSKLYGKTSNEIINNIKILNDYDLTVFNNDDYNKYSKLCIDLYGNNNTIINNNIIQNISYNIYNVPNIIYKGFNKINSQLTEYLQSIQYYYQEQLTYVNNNNDYLLLTNKNEYNQSYNNVSDFNNTIQHTFFTGTNYTYTTLFPIINTNINSIYFNNMYFDISYSSINTFSFIGNNIDGIINYDKNYNVEIFEINNQNISFNRFNFLGLIYLDSNTIINFNNIIDTTGYNYIMFDNNRIYEINNYPPIIINQNNKNGFLYNLIKTNFTETFTYIGTIYYYKIKINLDNINIGDLGNILYNNNKIYYFDLLDYNNNIIEIISTNIFDFNLNTFLIGRIDPQNINDILHYNFNLLSSYNVLTILNNQIIETYLFTHYSTNNIISNNFLLNNYFQPIIKKIYGYTFINIQINSNVDLNYYNFTTKSLPPFKINTYNQIISSTPQDIFNKYKNTSYIKLDKYILKINELVNEILYENNFSLSFLPNLNLNLIEIELSGSLFIIGNSIVINFINIDLLYPNSYYLINNRFIYLDTIQTEIVIYDNNIKYYNEGSFEVIYLLNDDYINKSLPLICEYKFINLQDNFLKNKLYGDIGIIKNNYVINSIIDNKNLLIYDSSSTYINLLGKNEYKIELILNNGSTNFIRPIILKNNDTNLNNIPIASFKFTHNLGIYYDSLIILERIPQINESFTTVEFIFNEEITSLISLNPSISIYSNSTFTLNSISFNNIQNINFNNYYLFKLLLNDTYPIYFWVYISNIKFTYTNTNISEPIYLQDNKIINILPNIQLISSIPNITTQNDNSIILSTKFYNYYIRTIQSQYYISNFYKDETYNMKIIDYNFDRTQKITPTLNLIERRFIKSYNNSFIYLDISIINIIKNAIFIIIFNDNNYYFLNNIITNNDGVYVNINNQININIEKDIIIYYSLNEIYFNKNNIVIYKDKQLNYKIINYQYNDLKMNELVLIENNLFLVLGLDTYNNTYDLQLLNITFNEINKNITGYYSLGVIDIIDNFIIDEDKNEPLIYFDDSSTLEKGDYYFKNGILNIITDSELYSDIFRFIHKGITYELICINNKYYFYNNFNLLKILDNLIYNNQIYKIKYIKNHEIFFYNNPNLTDGFYNFYYPSQPFPLCNIVIDNTGNIINKTFLNSDLIEIDFNFYNIINQQIINLPEIYFNKTLIIRYYTFNNNILYFNNEVNPSTFINNELSIKIKSFIIDARNISLELDFVINNYFYYLQPIKINSTINYVKSIIYRDTTIFIEVLNDIKITGNCIISFTPIVVYLNKTYSILNLENNQNSITNFNYIIENNQLVNLSINDNQNIETNFINNYISFDNHQLELESYHLLLEITEKNEYISHFIQIIYPNKIKLYTNILYESSAFYLDKKYPIIIDFVNFNYYFKPINYYKVTQLLDRNKNEIIIWYKYNITTIGSPNNVNNKFKIQILDGSQFLNKNIYLSEQITNPLSIIYENNKYYLVSDSYLGNNITTIYLYEINYIKNYKLNNSIWLSNFTNHDDLKLTDIFNFDNTDLYSEKIVIPVKVTLINIGDYYKYEIKSINNKVLFLSPNNKYYIDNLYLKIEQIYVYNSQTIIFTKSKITNENTQLYILNNINLDYFNKLKLSKTIPEIISKIKTDTNITPNIIFNSLKTWSNWSILSFYENTTIKTLLNKGKIIYDDNTFQIDNSEIYFTNNELDYLKKLLIYINLNQDEYDKIIIQQQIFNDLIYELKFWLNDYSFWDNVKDRINFFLKDYKYYNVYFNGYCLIFNDEDLYSDNIIIDKTTIIQRKYTLNNQYIIENQFTITRNMNLINNEIYNFINNIQTNSYYGIEINNLLKYLYIQGNNYIKFINDINIIDDKNYTYFNVDKLIINNIWLNYKYQLKQINQDFNNLMEIQNNISNYSELNKYYIFNDDFTFTITSNIPNNECYIYKTNYYSNTFFISNDANYTIKTNNIFPYYISYSNDIILPDVIYSINFINNSIKQILNYDSYSSEINFYLLNNYDPTIDFTLIGITTYPVTSIFLGIVYEITLNSNNIIFNNIFNVNYKNNNVQIYFNFNKIYIISKIHIQQNNILEISYKTGIKEQNSIYLSFYNNNFDFIEGFTYIKYNEYFILLHYNESVGYYLDKNIIIITESVEIVNLLNIITSYNTNTYTYELILTKPFTYYNNFINNPTDLLPTNFKLNNEITPIEINIINNTNFYVIVNNIIDISNIVHYINIGETIPLQIDSITKSNIYLYQTNIYVNIIENSQLYLCDISNQYLCNTENLDLSLLQFTLNENIELENKYLRNDNIWLIEIYTYNPNNKILILEFPTTLDFKNTNNYKYYINNNLIDTLKIQIGNSKITIELSFDLNTTLPIEFKQEYYINTNIYKKDINSLYQIKLFNDYDLSHYTKFYLQSYNKYGESIGKYLYKVVLESNININDLLDNLILLESDEYSVKLFYFINTNTIIIGCDIFLNLSKNYFLMINKYIIRIMNITFEQNNLQNMILYNQIDTKTINVFCNENCNEYNFINQIKYARYYISGINNGIKLVNIIDNRIITRSNLMELTIKTETIKKTDIIKPQLKLPIEWIKKTDFCINDQIIETLNSDTMNITYNVYLNAERKKQVEKMIQIKETPDYWMGIVPLDFWFSHSSTLSLPLLSLPHVELLLKYQIENLNNIIINDMTNCYLSNIPQIKVELNIDSIILDTKERELFGSTQHEYLIERYKIYPINLVYNLNQIVSIKLFNLVKDIIFITQPIYHLNDTSYKNITYLKDFYYNDYFITCNLYDIWKNTRVFTEEIPTTYLNSFLILEEIDKELLVNNTPRIIKITSNEYLNKFELKFELYLMDKYLKNHNINFQINRLTIYFNKLYKNQKTSTDISPIINMTLKNNGDEFFSKQDYNYFNSLVPSVKFKSSPNIGYYIYSFSLNPTELQHSGHLNFNFLDNVQVDIESNDLVLSEPYNLKVIVKEYQIIRIMSGIGSLAWL